MDRNKIRKYPPIVVTCLTAAVMMTAAFGTIAQGTSTPPPSLPEAVYEPQVTAIPTVTPTAAPIVTPEPEATPAPETGPAATAEPEENTYQSKIGSRDWGAEDAERLMKIAMAEAEGESVEGKALVMLVVLNRVWSDEFPDTIEEVIFQPNQFSVTEPGGRYYTTEPDEGCREALALVSAGWDGSQGALYFESCENDSWHSRNLEYLFQEGNHRFYR